MTRFDIYITRSFIGGCVPVLLLLLSLFSFLALAEELEDVGKGAYELSDALWVVIYTLPSRIVELLPVTVLLGGLMGLGALANHRELVSMSAAAISPLRITLPIARLAAFLILLVGLSQSWIIPLVEHQATQLRAKTLFEPVGFGLDSLQEEVTEEQEFWTKDEGQFIRIAAVRPDRSLADVEIYQFDKQGDLKQVIQTPKAELLNDERWLMYDVQLTHLSQNQSSNSEFKETLAWNALLSEEQTRTLISPASSLAPRDLWQLIKRLDKNGINSESHRIMFWNQIGISIGLLGMALLTLPFLLGSVRSVPVGQRVAAGGLIGISYYLIQQISGHAAGILSLNAALTVLAPSILILVLALILLKRAN